MIKTDELSKSYVISKKNKVDAVNKVSVELPDKGMVVIVGKSGCGKTTLLNILGTLDEPTSGAVWLNDGGEGKDLQAMTEREKDEFRNCNLGIVFQSYNLIENWNVEQNVKIVLEQQNWTGKSQETIDYAVKQTLSFVDLEGMESRKIAELSGGQQQRVAIARAIIKQPKLLLADEPTGNLDSESSRLIMSILKKYASQCLVVIVTHDHYLAEEFADRILRIQDGKIIDDKEYPQNADKGDVLTVKARSNVVAASLKSKTVLKLAGCALRVKKLKLFFSLLALVIVFGIIKFCATIETMNIGKAVAHYLEENNSEYFYVFEEINYEFNDFQYSTSVYNRVELKNLLEKEFGKENCRPVMEGSVISTDTGEMAEECRLVLGGSIRKGDKLRGNLPVADNELVVTDYLLYELGIPDGKIGDVLFVDGNSMVISGIIDLNAKEILQGDDYAKKNELREYGCRQLVSKDYFAFLSKQDAIRVALAELNYTGEIGNAAEHKLTFRKKKALDSGALVWGRLPEEKGEMVLSSEYFESLLFFEEDPSGESLPVSFFDTDAPGVNRAFDGYLNLYKLFPTVKIVGVFDSESVQADVIMREEELNEITEATARAGVADSYEVLLTDKTRKDYKIYNALYESDCIADMGILEEVYGEFEAYSFYDWVFQLLLIIMGALLLLQMILFFSFNVKDNHSRIGILRALGIPYKDIGRIWVVEAMFVCAIMIAANLIINTVIIHCINQRFCERLGLVSKLIYHNLWTETLEVVCLLAVAILTVLAPIWLMSDKKIIELIRKTE